MTVVNIETPVAGLVRINNPLDFVIGAPQETDEELRERITTDYNSVGSGTQDTIRTSLEQVPSVISVVVDANKTFETSPEGVPPKAYESIVYHQTTNEIIAQEIWNNKPSGIETWGDETVDVVDANGDTQQVKFTPITSSSSGILYAHIRVKYSELTGEDEQFPSDGELRIQEAVAFEGNDYQIGQDVIGKRFFAPIYENVEGIEYMNIEVNLDTVIKDPNTIPEVDWVPSQAVGRTEIALFAVDRVLVETF